MGVQADRCERRRLSGPVAGGLGDCERLDHPFGQMRDTISAGDETEQYVVTCFEVYHGFRLSPRPNARGTTGKGYSLEYPAKRGFAFLGKRLKGFLEGLLELLLPRNEASGGEAEPGEVREVARPARCSAAPAPTKKNVFNKDQFGTKPPRAPRGSDGRGRGRRA